MMVSVIKVGGQVLEDLTARQSFLTQFAGIPGPKILVHGGGKIATQVATQWNIPTTMIEGRRVTDEKMLDVVTMVYGGLVNKQVVATLQTLGCSALGITGADGGAIEAQKRPPIPIDYGFVGDVKEVNASFFTFLLEQSITPVVAPLTWDPAGQLLNTNADTMASAIAVALSRSGLSTRLFYCFEKAGVLLNAEDESTVIPVLTKSYYEQLKADKVIFAGMIPKLDNAFAAIHAGVSGVWIGSSTEIQAFWGEGKTVGTLILETT